MMNVWVIPGMVSLPVLKTDCINRAKVVLPLDDGPEIPIIMALSGFAILDCVCCSVCSF